MTPPEITFSKVDFPAPLLPTRPMISRTTHFHRDVPENRNITVPCVEALYLQ